MGKWYNEAVFYHMYPLGMTGAPKENKEPETVHRLRELFPWIDHLKEIGVTAIYIGPLFESSTHGYDTKDYKKVDRRLGDNEDFKEFVRLAHENGIRVVVDGVFWMRYTTTQEESFLHFRISRKTENILRTAAGIKE